MADPKIPLSDLPPGQPGAYDKVAGVDTATGDARLFPMPQPGTPRSYATRASLPAASGFPEGYTVWVNNDATAANNGTWAVLGGVWVQSADRVTGLEGRVSGVEDMIGAAKPVGPLVNQVPNGNFAVESSTAGVPAGFSMTGTMRTRATPSLIPQPGGGAIMRLTRNNDGTTSPVSVGLDLVTVAGDVYYSCAWVRSTAPRATVSFYFGGGQNYEEVGLSHEFRLVSAIRRTDSSANTANFAMQLRDPGNIGEITGYMRFNLTAIFGAGNEPSVDDMDRLVRSLGYFDQDGELSNTTTAVMGIISGDAIQAAVEERQKAGVFRFSTFNTGGANTRPYVMRDTVKKARPDIAVFQEAFESIDPNSFRRVDQIYVEWPLKYFHFQRVTPNATSEFHKGWCTASSVPIEEVEWVAGISQGALRTVHQIHGRRVAVWNVHLPHAQTQAAQRTWVEALAAAVALDPERYVIVAGDFNTPRTTYGDTISPYTTDPLRALGFTSLLESLGWPSTYQIATSAFVASIDNIWIRPSMEFVDSGIIDSAHNTDHGLVWADIRFTGNDGDLYSPDGSRWRQTIDDEGETSWVKL